MIAAVYVRKSTEQNGVADDQKSVARQIDHARRYASKRDGSLMRPTSSLMTGSPAPSL
jgi:hypothetical protein